ncbi:MAG: acetyltransferase [Chitinophagaceae bacterium]|nr:acetyltransferase [Chitinophagaceae bacterium]
MNKPIIIFGIGKIAEVVHYYAVNECGFVVEAFCVDEAYRNVSEWKGRPVVSTEELVQKYPSQDYDAFVAVGYQNLNRLREEKCNLLIGMGYRLVSIISPTINTQQNIVYGWNCFIMSPSLIHPFVQLGNNVFVWSGAVVGHHSKLHDNTWVTSGANIAGNVEVGKNCFIAINVTITNEVTIGNKCFLGANTLVSKSLVDKRVVISENSKALNVDVDTFLRIFNIK